MAVHFSPLVLRRRSAIVLALVAGQLVGGALMAQAAHARSVEGIELDVEISGPSSTPAPTPSTDPGSGDSGAPGGEIVDEVVPPDGVDDALGDEPFDLSGILMLSGLSGTITTTVEPQGGDATLRFSVQSSASVPVDFDVAFQLDNSLGSRVAEVERTDLAPLEPGETRLIEATLPDVGQWTVYTARVIFTPPAEVDGVELTPIIRDTTIVVAPFFSIVAGAGAAAIAVAALAVGTGASGIATGLGALNARFMRLVGR